MSLSHLEVKEYDVTCKCLTCNRPFTKRVSEKHYLEMINGRRPDPLCQRKACKKSREDAEIERKARNMAAILTQQRAPGTFSNNTRAIDITNRIVTEDYGLSNIRDADSVRGGETAVPRLAPAQQEAVENFWGGPKRTQNPMVANRVRSMAAAAVGGGLSGNASAGDTLTAIARSKYRPPVRIINER